MFPRDRVSRVERNASMKHCRDTISRDPSHPGEFGFHSLDMQSVEMMLRSRSPRGMADTVSDVLDCFVRVLSDLSVMMQIVAMDLVGEEDGRPIPPLPPVHPPAPDGEPPSVTANDLPRIPSSSRTAAVTSSAPPWRSMAAAGTSTTPPWRNVDGDESEHQENPEQEELVDMPDEDDDNDLPDHDDSCLMQEPTSNDAQDGQQLGKLSEDAILALERDLAQNLGDSAAELAIVASIHRGLRSKLPGVRQAR